ncbi:MAG: TauD/TfdA family dioxygenase [Alphaproteobacteria bacterium]|jgi:hypothetical protein|nr:TauD/TfdA family dioxygenase [Alphaproteobacteria bacterium]
MAASTDWKFPLDDAAIAEIETALDGVMHRGLDWREIGRADFPLPTVSGLLDEIAEHLEHGPGLAKLTGLEIDRYSEAERRALFFGLGQNLGTPVSMSKDGMMMSEVTDEGAAAADRYGALQSDDGDGDESFLSSRARVHSTGRLRYHTDRADVVALLCVAKAKQGGVNKLASVPRVHNEMLARRPDLLEFLFQDYYRSRLGEEFGDNASWYAVPVFALRDGHFTTHYSRTYIEAAQLNDEVPKMAQEHWQAIELMAEIAEEVAFETCQAPGEIQLLNSHVTFHARTAYEDHPEPERRRLLYRLWLSMANSRPLPESFAVLFRDVRPGAVRGGILPASA